MSPDSWRGKGAGWPDANNDEGAPVDSHDLAFIGVVAYAFVLTVLVLTHYLIGWPA